ncbi:L-2,4-diaminobutyrate decarboxylase [Planctomycetes bacterium Poly30]|uniref:L-2,4-diaminobutyrate decarboxylase n=1 Tax=Saltatorellus ferox TaxID=2528018 RepID=A0A518ERD4_9BACT|nr:L-2,4-diaminobutyrate decarboxylase [Planctomycetes bacterium Poly30]
MTSPYDEELRQLSALEARSRELQEPAEVRREWTDLAVEFVHGVVDGLDERRAWETEGGAREELLALGVPEEPASAATVMDLVEREIDGPGLQPASGGHLGYIPGGGVFPGALGDLIAAATNRYSGVRYAGPGAVAVENLMLRWLRDEIGLPKSAHGTLTSGGSIATLVAFVAARDAKGIRARDVEQSVVYTTSQAHHCVAKALAIAGLSECVQRTLPVDARYSMDVEALQAQVAADRASGLTPFLLVGTAGTTDTGAVDPLNALADIAAQENLWYHVDGAYGAAFALVSELRSKLAGIERADSVVMDPHKGLFLPYGTGAVLVRDPAHLARSHGHRGAYLQDITDIEDEPSPADLSPELTRHFRGLRMWLPLVLHGAQRFRAALHEKHLLARYFHRRASALGFEVGPEPALSVALFRWVPPAEAPVEEVNRINADILKAVLDDGRVFLSSTRIEGRFWIRAAILCFRTHREHVDHVLGILERVTQEPRLAWAPPAPK